MKKIVLIGLLFVVVCMYYGCNNTEKDANGNDIISSEVVNNPNTAKGISDTTKLPKFQFEQETHDFGKIVQGEKVSYSFKFKNVGKMDMVISSATGSCGCTVPNYSKRPIRPNESSTIDVIFNSEGKKGFISKTVTLMANTQPSTKVLTIKAIIKELEN